MTPVRSHHWHTVLRFAFTCVCALNLLFAMHHPCAAAELADQAQSLKMAPADTAFYSASLKLREQFDIFFESNAYSRLMQVPLVQFAKGQIEFQWQQAALPGVKDVREYIESDEGQETVALLQEMFADEVFVYGGSDIAEWATLIAETQSIQRTARLEATANDEDLDQVMSRKFRELFEERGDDVSVPTLVIGFRVKDADRAEQHLDVVQGHLRTLLDEKQPELAAHLQREQIAGHEFLTLRLDGSMIPWEKLREDVDEEDEEEFDKWSELLSKKTATAALGVVDEFVLLSIGESTDHLETLGQGEGLAQHEAIKRLAKHADERIVSITYMSAEVAKKLRSPEKTVNDIATALDEQLTEAEVSEEKREPLIDDIRELDLSRFIPTPGETSAVVFITDRGYEGFQYQTGSRPMMNSSEPLTILKHVGGDPLIMFASRANDTVEDYDQAVEWLKRAAKHVEAIAEEKVDSEDWEKFQEHRDDILSLLKRLNDATREHIYPAFEQNEGAIVINASAKSKQWTKHMPKSPKDLPMLELGAVCSVSNADQLRKGVDAYCDILRDALELARKINPEIPEFDIPKPVQKDVDDKGNLYVFSLPDEWGVDEQVAPTAGLTGDAAVLSTMPAMAEQLLEPATPEIDTAIDLNRPAATITHVKIAEFFQIARPWIDYGLGVATGTIKKEKPKDDEESEESEAGSDDDAEDDEEDEADQPSPLALQLGFVMPQVYQLLDVASAVQSATSITYEEDGIWVTHSETHIQDLED